jgi:hypothetical protein
LLVTFTDIELDFVDVAITVDAPPPIETCRVEVIFYDRFIVNNNHARCEK